MISVFVYTYIFVYKYIHIPSEGLPTFDAASLRLAARGHQEWMSMCYIWCALEPITIIQMADYVLYKQRGAYLLYIETNQKVLCIMCWCEGWCSVWYMTNLLLVSLSLMQHLVPWLCEYMFAKNVDYMWFFVGWDSNSACWEQFGKLKVCDLSHW